MLTFLFLVVVGWVAYTLTTAETRRDALTKAKALVVRFRGYGAPALEPFGVAIRARTPLLVVTPALVVILIGCSFLIDGARSISDGPHTTNGEWWRLFTATATQRSVLLLVINAAVICQVGRIVERLAGRLVFLGAFVAAALFAGLTVIWQHPLAAWSGASGAVAGLYGLLAVCFVAGLLCRSDLSIPPVALTRALPLVVVFGVLALVDHGSLASADLVGFFAGVAVGIIAAHDVSVQLPDTRRAAMAIGGAAVVAVAIAIPLRGILDVTPELQQLAALERRTRESYDAAYERRRRTGGDAKPLVALIDGSILPALHAADEHIAGLRHVPAEHAPRVASARRYLQLRAESWTLLAQSLTGEARSPSAGADLSVSAAAFRARAQASHRAAALIRGRAEETEHEALESLDAAQAVPLTVSSSSPAAASPVR